MGISSHATIGNQTWGGTSQKNCQIQNKKKGVVAGKIIGLNGGFARSKWRANRQTRLHFSKGSIFLQVFQRFSKGFPEVFQRFSNGFPGF